MVYDWWTAFRQSTITKIRPSCWDKTPLLEQKKCFVCGLCNSLYGLLRITLCVLDNNYIIFDWKTISYAKTHTTA